MQFPIILPEYIVRFMDTFIKNGYQIYVVGGPIRDLLLGKTVTNWDFATSADPIQIQSLFAHSIYENKFGTVLVPQDISELGQLVFEVTPFRHEGTYSDNRRPDSVEWANSIHDDLKRRDFTINALAYNDTESIDEHGGMDDLENKVIRAVGDPAKRFGEDALRLMRAVRLATQLGFTIDPQTEAQIRAAAPTITNISSERIRDELLKIISFPNAHEGILLLKDLGLLIHILPEVEASFTIDQKSPGRHHIDDVGTHLTKTLQHCPSTDVITRLAALLHDIGKVETVAKDPHTQIVTFYNHEVAGAKQAQAIAKRLRLSKKQSEKLVLLVRYHMFSVSELQTDKAIRRFIRLIGKENIQDFLDIRTGDRLGSGAKLTSWRTELFKERLIEVQKEPFTVHDLKLSGSDIMAELNLKPGPEIGRILNELFEMVVEKGVGNTKEELLKTLTTLSSSGLLCPSEALREGGTRGSSIQDPA